jgi:hypothetical protein
MSNESHAKSIDRPSPLARWPEYPWKLTLDWVPLRVVLYRQQIAARFDAWRVLTSITRNQRAAFLILPGFENGSFLYANCAIGN